MRTRIWRAFSRHGSQIGPDFDELHEALEYARKHRIRVNLRPFTVTREDDDER